MLRHLRCDALFAREIQQVQIPGGRHPRLIHTSAASTLLYSTSPSDRNAIAAAL
jgi:hypothetical protein